MIRADDVRETLAQYQKFGWRLERVILTPVVRDALSVAAIELFKEIPVTESDLNAMWFSRANANGRIAWELRTLGPTPFALVDSTEPGAAESELTELFERVENQMRQRLIRPRENL